MSWCVCFALGITVLMSPVGAWTLVSRELVDLQHGADQSLRILVSAPGAAAPGLYVWRTDAIQPKLLCRIASPVTFSFDRTLLIERTSGETSVLRISNAANCRLLATIRVAGHALDVDARGRYVAVAVRLPDKRYELHTYTRRGRLIAAIAIGRNVEMGFAPDGRSLVNFDLSDRGATLWRVPTLGSVIAPVWLADGETTFVAGSALVKQYASEQLSVLRWPGGKQVYSVPASRAVRLRALSSSGRYGLLHERQNTGESLDWIDFATHQRMPLVTGSVDHASISASGDTLAWSLRDAQKSNTVQVQRTTIVNAVSTTPVKY